MARNLGQVDGSNGDDQISVIFRQIHHTGGGDDVITVSASLAETINGGTGNDQINLNVGIAMIRRGENGGQDIVNVARAEHLTISFATANFDELEITRDDDTLTLTSANGDAAQIVGLSNVTDLYVASIDPSGQIVTTRIETQPTLNLSV
ncbi:MAG: hypothetical protein ACU0C9_11430 [Paracoccaceae bacterium]